jgi:hypothetical protein
MVDPITILALFGPAIKDGAMSLIKKWTGDSAGKPANAQEAVMLIEAETKQLEARIKTGDTEGETYPWVIAVIKLQRPFVVYATLLTFLVMSTTGWGGASSLSMVANLFSTVVFWLFGERYQMKSK